MTEYKTVMYLDSEVHFIQDDGVMKMLQCAATGKLLMTAGPMYGNARTYTNTHAYTHIHTHKHTYTHSCLCPSLSWCQQTQCTAALCAFLDEITTALTSLSCQLA